MTRDTAALSGEPRPDPEQNIADLLDSEAVADFFGGGFESGEIRWLSAFLASGLAALSGSPQETAPKPLRADDLREALVNGLAYALARATLPEWSDTSRKYAERLVPLVIESAYLDEAIGKAQRAVGETPPGPLDALRALSEAATPGPWRVGDDGWGVVGADEDPRHTLRIADDSAFIVAAVNYVRAVLTATPPGGDR